MGRTGALRTGLTVITIVACGAAVLGSAGTTAAAPLAAGRAAYAPVATATAVTPEAAAMQEARRSGRPVEVTELTTEHRKVLADPATGQFEAKLNAFPVRTKRTGTWKDIDLTLERKADGSVGPVMAAEEIRFSGGGNGRLAMVTQAGSDAGFSWPSALPTPELSGTTATYREVFPGADLMVKTGVEGFSTYLVVKDARAAKDPRVQALSFGLTGSATSPRASGRQTDLVDAKGAARFSIAEPRMWDSTGAVGPVDGKTALTSESPRSRTAPMAMKVANGHLQVSPDTALLTGPDTVFPVVIDPALSVKRENKYWTMVWSNGSEFPNHATELARVGYNGWESPYFTSRVFYAFDTAFLYGKHVRTAVFSHKLVHTPNNDCTASTYGPGVTLGITGAISSSTVWGGPSWTDTISTNAKAHGNASYCSGYDQVDWAAQAEVQKYAGDVSRPTLTFGLKSSSESNRDGWRKFDNDATLNYPLLSVTYGADPNAPGTPTMDNATGSGPSGFWTTDSTPTLRARLTDPDGTAGGQLRGRFEIYYNGSVLLTSGTSTAVNHNSDAVWTIPAGKLVQGTLYTVRVWALDDLGYESGSWSPYIQFRADWTPPATAPTVTAGQAGYTVGQSGSFLFRTPDTDVTSYCYGLNTDTTATCVATSAPTVDQTVTVASMPKFGPSWLTVRTRDAAGNLGPVQRFDFRVDGSAPVGWWRLDGNGTDGSGGARTLAFTGAPAFVDGRWAEFATDPTDKALSVNGTSQHAATTVAGPVGTSGSFSAAAWVRMNPTSNNYPTAVSQVGSTYAAFYLGVQAGKPSLILRSADSLVALQSTLGTEPMPTGQWVHLVGIYSAAEKKARLYVDGAKVGETTVTAPPFAATGALTVGRSLSSGAPSDLWPGAVDEVRVYNGVLDESQVRTIFAESRP
ncbi:LamG domain-containing protein [Pedococcus dokdonensis]|uniref:LamG domain-containing protein n=1 Tax=Pedococcus dokdonensis TaxID=443156 RepID=UPI0012FD2FC1|nr:LamG domain-containing protein [Pedococcus dokdonensis]